MPKAEEQDQEVETLEPPGPAPVTITAEDGEEDDVEEKAGNKETVRDGKTGRWTEKKNQRRNAIKENEEFRTKQTAMEAKLDQIRADSTRQMAELIAALRQPQQGQQQERQDPGLTQVDQQIDQTYALMEASLAKIAAGAGPEETKNYYKLQRQQTALIARAEGMKAGWGRQPERQESGLDPEKAARMVTLKSEFPDLNNEDSKSAVVAGHIRRGLIASNHPDTLDTDRLAMTQAYQHLGMSSRAAPPSQRSRQAFAGPPSGGRMPAGKGTRSIEINPRLLEGSGLSKEALSRALFDDDNE